MKGTKFTELQNQDAQTLERQIAENRARLTALEFQKVIGQLENHAQIPTLRRDIARMKTALAAKNRDAQAK
jgi:large subunit ribosomal protein L29